MYASLRTEEKEETESVEKEERYVRAVWRWFDSVMVGDSNDTGRYFECVYHKDGIG